MQQEARQMRGGAGGEASVEFKGAKRGVRCEKG